MSTVAELLAEGEKAADEVYRATLEGFGTLAKKTCTRCGGSGTYQALHLFGDCFGCGGTGFRPVSPKESTIRNAHAMVARLRVLWKATSDALTLARSGSGWASRSEVRQLERKLERKLTAIEASGKAYKEQL